MPELPAIVEPVPPPLAEPSALAMVEPAMSAPLPELGVRVGDVPPDTTAEIFPEIGGDRPVLRHGRGGDHSLLARLLVDADGVREWPMLASGEVVGDADANAVPATGEELVANVAAGLRALLGDPRARVWVAQVTAEDGPRVVGFGAVSWRPDPLSTKPQACVEILFVLPAWRGRGTGTRIMQACRATARVVGATLISIGPALMAANPRPTAFFHRQGFAVSAVGLHRAP